MKILIIDDDRYFAEDLQYFLEKEGFDCTVYQEVDEVCSNFEHMGGFDGIILDLMMLKGNLLQLSPSESALEEIGEVLFIRLRKQYPKMKIIIVTAKQRRGYQGMGMRVKLKKCIQIWDYLVI